MKDKQIGDVEDLDDLWNCSLEELINEFLNDDDIAEAIENTGIEEGHQTVIGYQYWDGHNHRTMILDDEFGEADLERVEEELEKEILDDLEKKERVKDDRGLTIYEGEKYYFIESHYTNAWERYEVMTAEQYENIMEER
jgi:hypothetical protein